MAGATLPWLPVGVVLVVGVRSRIGRFTSSAARFGGTEVRIQFPPAVSRANFPGRGGLSDTAAVAGDFGLRNLRRDYPSVEPVPRNVLRGGNAHAPGIQGRFYVKLLARGEIDILVLIEVSVIADGGDVIVPRRNIAVERAAVCDRPEIAAVHIDICEIKAVGRLQVAVEPDPGLARRDRRRCDRDLRGRPGTARGDQQQATSPSPPSSGNVVLGHHKN